MAAEEAHQGRNMATLEVVIEAASPLMHGQLEGLGCAPGRYIPRRLGSAALHGCGNSAKSGGGLATPLTLASSG